MKIIRFLTILTLMVVCLIPDAFGQGVVSRHSKQTSTKPTPAKPKLTVNGHSESLFIDFSDTGETKQLEISTNQGTPTVQSMPTWLSITGISAKSIDVKCEPNPTTSSRDGSFEIKAGKLSVTVEVSQPAGMPQITNVDFGNTDYNGNTINDFGSQLYASDIRYLTPRITYNGPGSRQSKTIYVKIFGSNGKLMEGNNSPSGYTTKWDVTFESGKNKNLIPNGWGNNSRSPYDIGEISLEIYYDGINIYNASVNLEKKPTESTYLKVDQQTSISQNYDADGGSRTFTISTDAREWSVKNVPSFCEVTNRKASSFTLKVNPNIGASRNGSLYVKTDNQEVKISISQESAIETNMRFLRSMIEEANREFPEKMENGIATQRFFIEGDFVVCEQAIDENIKNIDFLKNNYEIIKASLKEILQSESDPMINTCIKAKMGLAFKYVGWQSGKSFYIRFSCTDLKNM